MIASCTPFPITTLVRPVELEREELSQSGLAHGVPTGIGPEVDAERAARASCVECGNEGLDYEPWIGGGHYVILAVCGRCEYAYRW